MLAGAADTASDASVERPTRCSPTTWKLFLQAERCAHAIDSRLSDESRAALTGDTQRIIKDAATDEAKRALSARGQLQLIGKLVQRDGLPAVVLKGGVAVARGTTVHLVDIDVLVPPDSAGTLASALEAEGYCAAGFGSPRHLAARTVPGALPVEIHTTTHRAGTPLDEMAWRDPRPLEGTPGLLRLRPAEHLWHVMFHTVVDHPYRRGRIRDLVVLADALGDCSETDLDEVTKRSAASPHAATFARLLEAVRAHSAGDTIPDAFEATALEHYTATALMNRLPVPSVLRETVWKWTFALLGGREELREVWTDTLAVSLTQSPYRLVSTVERRLPRLGRAWRLIMRLLRLSLAIPIAIVIAIATRYSLDQS